MPSRAYFSAFAIHVAIVYATVVVAATATASRSLPRRRGFVAAFASKKAAAGTTTTTTTTTKLREETPRVFFAHRQGRRRGRRDAFVLAAAGDDVVETEPPSSPSSSIAGPYADLDFDPLRSPHEYPDGIGGDAADNVSFLSDMASVESPPSSSVEASNKDDSAATSEKGVVDGGGTSAGPYADLDFDPLRSPHEYPDGVGGTAAGNVSFLSDMASVESPPSSAAERFWSGERTGQSDAVDLFDPTLSPHVYLDGVPDGCVGTQKQKAERVAILIIDHGSKREASNERLNAVAEAFERQYKSSVSSSSDNDDGGGGREIVAVRACHMEIAAPSILDGMRSLLEEFGSGDGGGLTKIVCHPYFLSPGKHAVEDVPRLIEDAVLELGLAGRVEVVSTEPLGSNLDAVVSVVGQLVDRALDGE